MTARLTVVLDDDDLYRRVKVHAAEEGIPMKRLVEDALTRYLGDEQPAGQRMSITGKSVLAWMDEMRERDPDPNGPNDLSDIKHHLYGWPKRHITDDEWRAFVAEQNRTADTVRRGSHGLMQVAEERVPYDAGN